MSSQATRQPYTHNTLVTSGLTTGYKQGKIISTALDLTIKNGELVALLGANGCGKSTLMRSIAGLQDSLGGDVQIVNHPVFTLKAKHKARLLSLVLTEKVEAINLNVWDIVSVGRYPYVGHMGTLTDRDKEIVRQSLAQCALEGFSRRLFSELSDGERQRVMIARALAQDTPVMILDEPTAHLDLPNRIDMMRMLYELSKKTSKAILLSTHELDLAMQWADTIWLMNSEGDVLTGTPEDLALNGSFARVFGSKHATFDLDTGLFKINRQPIDEIAVVGHGAPYTWTCRALERQGFRLSSSPTCHCSIEVTPTEWVITKGEKQHHCPSISALLTTLQTDDYWTKVMEELS